MCWPGFPSDKTACWMRQVQGKEFQKGAFSFLEQSIIKITEIHRNEIHSPQNSFKKFYLLILTAWSGEQVFLEYYLFILYFLLSVASRTQRLKATRLNINVCTSNHTSDILNCLKNKAFFITKWLLPDLEELLCGLFEGKYGGGPMQSERFVKPQTPLWSGAFQRQIQ